MRVYLGWAWKVSGCAEMELWSDATMELVTDHTWVSPWRVRSWLALDSSFLGRIMSASMARWWLVDRRRHKRRGWLQVFLEIDSKGYSAACKASLSPGAASVLHPRWLMSNFTVQHLITQLWYPEILSGVKFSISGVKFSISCVKFGVTRYSLHFRL